MRLALSAPDDLPFDFNHRRFGEYDLGRQIGAGGMGVVYEAWRLSDGKRVALKLIRNLHAVAPLALCRFTIEAEAAARLEQPNIVRIHEIGEINGQPFFSMDYVDGESLMSKIGGESRSSPSPLWGEDRGEGDTHRYCAAAGKDRTRRPPRPLAWCSASGFKAGKYSDRFGW